MNDSTPVLNIRPARREADWRWKHGFSRHPLYSCWKSMIDRCQDSSHHAFKDYGGRGITVCARWLEVANFIKDMGQKPSPSHSLDRRDNDGNYEPLNCQWATKAEQQHNKRRARKVTAFGVTRHISEWEASTGIPAQTIWARIFRRNKTPEIALSATLRKGPWKTEDSPV